MICRRSSNGLGLDCGKPAAVPPGSFATAVLVDPNAEAKAQQQYQASMLAYGTALARLNASWLKLPLTPYPPASDTATTFPRTGTPALMLTRSMVSQAALAEPGKVTQNLLDQSIARRPKLNAAFAIGAVCLAAYFVVR